MTASKIEWTERSDWNPIRGCTRVSPGCGGPGDAGGCYAEAIAARFSGPGQPFEGYATRTAKGPRWTGQVDIMWDRIDLPLRWRQPALIFASSTSDFFHKDLDPVDVTQLFGVMIAAHHLRGHRFQVLTKRANIMREWLNSDVFWMGANSVAEGHIMNHIDPLNRRSDDARATCDDHGPDNPPPGIWLGVSVEDQTRADERIPDLLQTPAAVRFLSCEPMLGDLDLTSWLAPEVACAGCDDGEGFGNRCASDAIPRHEQCPWKRAVQTVTEHGPISEGGEPACITSEVVRLDWVIAGGESGPNARPMHPDWARSLREQCASAGVPFHFKQWGEYVPAELAPRGCLDLSVVTSDGEHLPKGHGLDRLDDANAEIIARVGKRTAGRLLDGVEHNGMPAVRS